MVQGPISLHERAINYSFPLVDGGKNPSQQRETLPIPQVSIRLMNVWYGRLNGIMDPLPSIFGWLQLALNLKNIKDAQLSETKLSYQTILI